ncbi:MAG: hypothetical protein KJ574_03395, partial [Nanoarchaeota archaeon]|nr:hypothetical protein [Nanoarchaeota archaeon]
AEAGTTAAPTDTSSASSSLELRKRGSGDGQATTAEPDEFDKGFESAFVEGAEDGGEKDAEPATGGFEEKPTPAVATAAEDTKPESAETEEKPAAPEAQATAGNTGLVSGMRPKPAGSYSMVNPEGGETAIVPKGRGRGKGARKGRAAVVTDDAPEVEIVGRESIDTIVKGDKGTEREVEALPRGVELLDDKHLTRWAAYYVVNDSVGKVTTRSIEYVNGLALLEALAKATRTICDLISDVDTPGKKYRLEDMDFDQLTELSYRSEDICDAMNLLKEIVKTLVAGYNRSLDDAVMKYIGRDGNLPDDEVERITLADKRSIILGPDLKDVLVQGILPEIIDISQVDSVFNDTPIPSRDSSAVFRKRLNLAKLRGKIDSGLRYMTEMSAYHQKMRMGIKGVNYLAQMLKK